MTRFSSQIGDPRFGSGGNSRVLPPGTAEFGMYLFLAALSMLFAASIVGYLAIWWNIRNNPNLATDVVVQIPSSLWLSTILLLISSVTVHHALKNVRRERQTSFRYALAATLLLAIGFVAVQFPSLMSLLTEHRALARDPAATGEQGFHLYGLIFSLILVHALHVIGGVVPLSIVTRAAYNDRYDHEHHGPVKYLALYWHFLDLVWVVMFLTFLLT